MFGFLLIYEIPSPSDSSVEETIGLASIEINTFDGTFPYLKEYQQANVTYYDNDGTILQLSAPADIRCRGNSTFSYAKKAYKIEFDQNVGMLPTSQKVANEWVLLANYLDGSMLRNQFAFQLGNTLDGIDFVPDSKFVNVYINGAYMGVYLLCDQVEVGVGRVEIDTSLPASDAGFLLTIDTLSTGVEYLDYFQLETNNYSYCSTIYSVEQGMRIADIVATAENTIINGSQEEISQVIDLDSCIDMYILQEFMKNYDIGWGSFYIYANRGEDTLYFGPPWDFDMAAGNDPRLDNGSYEELFVGQDEFEEFHTHLWYYHLMSYDWFQEAVTLRWNEVKDDIYEEILSIETLSHTNETYFLEDSNKFMFTDTGSDKDVKTVASDYVSSAASLINWLQNRYTWLDDYFNEER